MRHNASPHPALVRRAKELVVISGSKQGQRIEQTEQTKAPNETMCFHSFHSVGTCNFNICPRRMILFGGGGVDTSASPLTCNTGESRDVYEKYPLVSHIVLCYCRGLRFRAWLEGSAANCRVPDKRWARYDRDKSMPPRRSTSRTYFMPQSPLISVDSPKRSKHGLNYHKDAVEEWK